MNKTTPRVYCAAMALILGLLTAPAEAQSLSLIPANSTWKYLDDGTDQGAAWRAVDFNDAGWPSGPAQIGFGDGDEATVINRTSPSGTTNLTFYFRHAFDVASPASITNLLVRLRRDDGAVVYLNDTEVFRSNLPPGPVSATTLALAAASDDGSNFVANSASPALLRPGRNVVAVEVHQNAATSSDISFDLELLANVQFLPPVVTIATPTNGTVIGSINVTVTAGATDADGLIATVEFYGDGALLGMDIDPPYSLVWSNVTVGTHTLRAVAMDNTGLSSTSAPVVITVPPRLVPSGAAWRYLDTGVDPGPGWSQPGFSDAGWPTGVAQLGFGDGDETTLLSRTNAAGATNITYYFRHEFDLPSTANITSLVIRVVRDDGCLAYLNGTEVFRDNLPAGPIAPGTLAVTAIDDRNFRSARISPGRLVAGRNVVAVEVHQAALTSSDISFDLELLPNVAPAPPNVALTGPADGSRYLEPASITLSAIAGDPDDRVVSVAFLVNGALVGTDTTEPYELTLANQLSGEFTVVAVATDELGQSSTSAPVRFLVVRPPLYTSLIATGSVWRYFDGGTDLGTAWREPAFDDSTWKSGAGKLGSNDNPVTTIDIGPVTGRFITTYFRRRFQADATLNATNLAFRVLRDDGCVVYLNGVELFRMNMAAGPMAFTNRALTIIGGTNEFHYFPMAIEPPAGLLRIGENLLAVELHQSDSTSSDAGFDLGLVAVSPPLLPNLSISIADGVMRIEWPTGGYQLQSAPGAGGPYSDVSPPVTASPYLRPAPATGDRFYRLRRQ